MRLLLDTHIALWLAQGGAALSAGEQKLLEASVNELWFSAVSVWELRLKWDSFHRSGVRKGPASPADFRIAITRLRCDELPLTGEAAVAELKTPLAHKDPFDELLLAQAQVLGLRLLTRDAKLADHPLAVTG